MPKKLSILLVEDDNIEIIKFKKIVTKLDIQCKIMVAQNGEKALEILTEKQQIPGIILLDLNMPKMNGVEFLSILKKEETLKHIPAIILTTSCNQKDLFECYKIGIAGYMLKPLKYSDYALKITKTISYWSENELVLV
jgi:CheY-like chemotaxis protein